MAPIDLKEYKLWRTYIYAEDRPLMSKIKAEVESRLPIKVTYRDVVHVALKALSENLDKYLTEFASLYSARKKALATRARASQQQAKPPAQLVAEVEPAEEEEEV